MISVLIVEDEPIAAEALHEYVRRIPGFVVSAVVGTGAEALRWLALEPVNLIFLDIYLPDGNGIDVLRRMRAAGHATDVIVVTRARDLKVVQTAASYGMVHYVVKPFTFGTVRDKLERYRTYHDQMAAERPLVTQAEVDRILAAVHASGETDLPKGIARESLYSIVGIIRDAGSGSGLSATKVAEMLGSSRVTARRYLEYLTELGLVLRATRYGGPHRPEVEYRWRPTGDWPTNH